MRVRAGEKATSHDSHVQDKVRIWVGHVGIGTAQFMHTMDAIQSVLTSLFVYPHPMTLLAHYTAVYSCIRPSL